jgi:CubicO group peptidase (beta-lactamase class C family)
MRLTWFAACSGVFAALSLIGCATPSTDLSSSGLRVSTGCEAAIEYSNSNSGLSVLVLRNGGVVCEEYANGGGPDAGHEIWSGTKSFTGIMAAIAARDGMLTLDEPVSRTITEWQNDPQRSRVTIRQLLTQSSGISNPPQPGGRAPGYATAVATPFTAAPGDKFQYGAHSFQVFGELMQRKLKVRGLTPDALHFIKSRILDPIGITWTDWRRTPEGDIILAQAASFTARDWAQFGEFVRKGGVTPSGERLVDPSTFKELFVGTSANPSYGVSWWLPRPTTSPDLVSATVDLGQHASEIPEDMVIAAGAGDQRLYVVPSCGLTVVRQAVYDPAKAAAARNAGARREWSDFAFIKPLLVTYCDQALVKTTGSS